MSLRILLAFEHATCDIGVDVHVPLSYPIKESREMLVDRVRPACPICKVPMIYTDFGSATPTQKIHCASAHRETSMKTVYVHWRFKEEPTRDGQRLCNVPQTARDATHSIVLRPIIRQKPGGALRECKGCAKIGKALGIP